MGEREPQMAQMDADKKLTARTWLELSEGTPAKKNLR